MQNISYFVSLKKLDVWDILYFAVILSSLMMFRFIIQYVNIISSECFPAPPGIRYIIDDLIRKIVGHDQFEMVTSLNLTLAKDGGKIKVS